MPSDTCSYPDIVKMDFSPSDISITPSSQPCMCEPTTLLLHAIEVRCTFDDLAYANLGLEGSTAFGGVESRN